MVLTSRLMNHKIVTCLEMFLGPYNAVKQTVGPNRNKQMQQPAAVS